MTCLAIRPMARAALTLRASTPTSEPLQAEELSPASEREWDEFVDSRPGAGCYHLRAWRTAAARAYGLAAPFLIVRGAGSGHLRGVLPLFVVENAFGGYLTTGLFGAYGNVLVDNDQARSVLLREARRLTLDKRLAYFVHKARGDEMLPSDFARHDPGVIAVLSLASPDTMWKGFRSEIRNRVRKAERSGLDVRWGGDQLGAFYRVLAENMHRKGTPVYGLAVMRELVQALGKRVEVVTLSRAGEVVSGALIIYYKGVVSVPFVSSKASAFQWCPSNLLYWEIIQRGWARGMRTLDFGRSFKNSSNLDFKMRWGAQTVPQPFFVYSRNGRQPKLDVEGRSVQGLIHLWKSLPLPVANVVGPWLCRRFLA